MLCLVVSLLYSLLPFLKKVFIPNRLINLYGPANKGRLDCIYLPLYVSTDKTTLANTRKNLLVTFSNNQFKNI